MRSSVEKYSEGKEGKREKENEVEEATFWLR